MRYADNIYIEGIANDILSKENITSPAVKADEIAEFLYELEFDWDDLDRFSSLGEVLAAISVKDKKIVMNASSEQELKNNPGRLNFTIAHELGHWVLHKNLAQEQLPGFEGEILICRGTHIKTNKIEMEANKFAAFLLMPQRFVEQALQNFSTPMTDCDIKRLADQFCVSKQAMMIRLIDELKVLYHANGRYHKSKAEFLEAGGQQTLF